MDHQKTLTELGNYITQLLTHGANLEKVISKVYDENRTLQLKLNDLNKSHSEQLIADGLGIVRALLRGDNVEARRKTFVERYPEFETNLLPRKQYYAEITVQGHDIFEVQSELRRVMDWVNHGHEYMLGGGVTLQTYIDRDMTPERYKVALDRYLELGKLS